MLVFHRPLAPRGLFGLVLPLLLWALAPAAAEENKTSEAQARRRSGQEALSAGRRQQARHFLHAALALEPESMEIVGDLLKTESEDPESQALWLHYAAAAGADARGRFKPARSWPKLEKGPLADARRILDLRTQALKAVSRAAAKLKGGRKASLARYLEMLERELGQGARRLSAPAAEAVRRGAEACPPESEKVLQALHKLMRKLLTDEAYGDALAAAKILRGLNQQEGQAEGKAATAGKGLPAVLSAERAARKALQTRGEKVHTLEELRAIPEPERDAWSRKHATWAHPGVAVSPTGLYRVETICGLETLLVVTEDIEHHHKRLVSWYGHDPFEKRPGLVRLCPNATDMESAGQPFWWAGGFQSGDVTTVHVNFTSRHGIAGVLTHELTHRFDGAVFPGMPSWLLEGRAVYSASCSVDPHSPTLDERRVGFGRFWKSNTNGYGRLDNLEKLLRGTIDDYRDNYDAGYTLWMFLRRFQSFDPQRQGQPIFAPRLDAYLRSFRKNRRADPVERFKTFFVDGKEGRPADWKALGPIWAQFVRDGAKTEAPPWRRAWQSASHKARRELKKKAPRTAIDDRATWHRARSRSDPVAFGEEHAYAAGLLLEKHGQNARALDAFEWALQVDEPLAERVAHVAARSRTEGAAAPAWVQALEAHRLDGLVHAAPTGAAPGPLAEVWRRVNALVDALGALEDAAGSAAQARLARAMRAERDRFGRAIGLRALDAVGERAPEPAEEPLPPDCGPYLGELATGVEDARWSPMDSQANKLWHMPTQAELELGRRKSADATTGSTLRDAGVRRVFVRGRNYHTGTYSFRTRVRFLSAHVSAKLVVGYTRRDRGVQISIGGGDFAYATGRREKAMELRSISVGVSDLRTFDNSASTLSRRFAFASPREVFSVTAHVDGPYIRVQINGRDVLVHRRSTHDPIQGYVGFGLGSGLIRFEDPATRHHRVLGPDHTCPCGAQDEPIRLTQPTQFPWSTCVGRRVEGLPLSPGGTLVVWYTGATVRSEQSTDIVADYVRRIREPFDKAKLPIALRVVLPPPPEEGDDLFLRDASFELPEGSVHVHAGTPNLVRHLEKQIEKDAQAMHKGKRKVPLEKARERARQRLLGGPVWLMLDDHGVVRNTSTSGVLGQAQALAHHLAGW